MQSYRQFFNKKNVVLFCLLTTIIISFSQRFYYIDKHFAAPDDTTSLVFMLDEKLFNGTYLEKKENLLNNKSKSFKLKIAKKIDDSGLLKLFFDYFAVPINTTAAPLVSFITNFLIFENQDYKTKITLGRIVSFTTSIFAIFIFFYLLKKYLFNTSYQLISLLGISILAFSYENIIFSINAMQYSIGVTSAIILIVLFYRSISDERLNYLLCILNSFIILILSSSQYQIIFILPAYYLGIFINHYRDKKILIKYFIESFLSLFLVLIFVFPFINLNWAGADVYTRGPNNEFFFSLPQISFFNNIVYILIFYTKNFFIILNNNLAFLPENSKLAIFFFYIFLFFFTLGFIKSFKKKSKIKNLGIFFLFILFTWIFLITINKLSFAPTRHQLILTPFMIIFFLNGITSLYSLLEKYLSFNIDYQLILSFLIIIFLHFSFFFSEFSKRKNPLINYNLNEVLEKNDIEKIFAYGFFGGIRLDKNIFENYKIYLSYHHYLLRSYDFKNNSYHNVRLREYDKITNIHSFEKVMFISNFFRLDKKHVKFLLEKFKMNYANKDFEIIYKYEINSDTQAEYSKMTDSESNDIYIYVLEFKS